MTYVSHTHTHTHTHTKLEVEFYLEFGPEFINRLKWP